MLWATSSMKPSSSSADRLGVEVLAVVVDRRMLVAQLQLLQPMRRLGQRVAVAVEPGASCSSWSASRCDPRDPLVALPRVGPASSVACAPRPGPALQQLWVRRCGTGRRTRRPRPPGTEHRRQFDAALPLLVDRIAKRGCRACGRPISSTMIVITSPLDLRRSSARKARRAPARGLRGATRSPASSSSRSRRTGSRAPTSFGRGAASAKMTLAPSSP